MKHPLAQFLYCPECGSPHFEVNNEKSKKCTDCGFVYYFNPSAATVALILNEKNELLVCRRAKEPAKGTLDLPGGFIDMNETGEEGVAREVLEETGLKVKKAVYQFTLPNIYVYSGFPVHTLDMFFLCTVEDMSHFSAMDDVADFSSCLSPKLIRKILDWILFTEDLKSFYPADNSLKYNKLQKHFPFHSVLYFNEL